MNTDILTQIKCRLTMEQVLEHYGIRLKRIGKQLRGPCPLHPGADNPTAFVVSNNLWYCHSRCQEGGDVIKFIMRMENLSFRDALAKAAQLAGLEGNITPKPVQAKLILEREHPYFTGRGVSPESVAYFGLAFCRKGPLVDHILIPLHDEYGKKLGWCGRRVDDGHPKYRHPKGFEKSRYLFNLHRARFCPGSLVIVEGFFDCIRIHQSGHPAVVALMGSSLSRRQEDLLVWLSRPVVLMLDGDDAGTSGTKRIIERLRGKLPIRLIRLEEGLQPDGLSPGYIRQLLK